MPTDFSSEKVKIFTVNQQPRRKHRGIKPSARINLFDNFVTENHRLHKSRCANQLRQFLFIGQVVIRFDFDFERITDNCDNRTNGYVFYFRTVMGFCRPYYAGRTFYLTFFKGADSFHNIYILTDKSVHIRF